MDEKTRPPYAFYQDMHPSVFEGSSNTFALITKAIEYLETHRSTQPSLEEISTHLETSPSHLQRLFTEWAGVSPKKFLQFLTLEHAKDLLTKGQISLLDAALKSGLSGSGRLHDLFVTIEGMTPGEYKQGGAGLTINYSFQESLFGTVLLASTTKGLCYLAFADDRSSTLQELRDLFPNAKLQETFDIIQKEALTFFRRDWSDLPKLKLHLKGTPFQLKVWTALLRIPSGQLCTYGTIASKINHPNAYRAVGTAVGQNPISFLIPCHRVIQASGILGNYHWGKDRKAAMIGWESARS